VDNLAEAKRIRGSVPFTKLKLLIFASAVESVVKIQTWFSHLEIFNIVTSPDKRTLSRYRGVTGRSDSSIAIFCLVLLSIDRGARYKEGSFIENGVPALSLNLMMYFENCAWEVVVKMKMNTKNKGIDLFM